MTGADEEDWTYCAEWLEKALSHDALQAFTLPEVRQEVEAGRAHFWRWPMERMLDPTACAVTNFAVFPRFKALNYWLLGGDMASIRAMLPNVETWGLMQGCTLFMGEGRRGFERAFGQDGYRAISTLYAKTISTGRMQ